MLKVTPTGKNLFLTNLLQDDLNKLREIAVVLSCIKVCVRGSHSIRIKDKGTFCGTSLDFNNDSFKSLQIRQFERNPWNGETLELLKY